MICAYTDKRWALLERAVRSARDQTIDPFEVIVVIDHNTDLAERARAELDAVVIENRGKRGLSDARNTGIEVARGEAIAFLDDDAHADKEWIERLQDALARPGVVGAGGLAAAEWAHERPQWFPRSFEWVVGCSHEGLPDTPTAVRNVIGCNMVFLRSAFDAVGGFNPEMGRIGTRPLGCEETELCIRLGETFGPESVWYEPAAKVGHFVPGDRGTWGYFVSRCYAEGLSKAVVVKLGGAEIGLASERTHALRVLPRAVVRSMAEVVTARDPWGVVRAAAIVIGFATTSLGFVRGSLARPNLGLTTRHVSLETN